MAKDAKMAGMDRAAAAKMAEDYFTGLPSKRFQWESLGKVPPEKLQAVACRPCLDGDHGVCRGVPEVTGQTTVLVDGVPTRAYGREFGPVWTPWQTETNLPRHPGYWNLFGRTYTETLSCQCRVHGHRTFPQLDGKCLVEVRSGPVRSDDQKNWCLKPAVGNVEVLRTHFVSGSSPPVFVAVPACGVHRAAEERRNRKRAELRERQGEHLDRVAGLAAVKAEAARWASMLSESTGVEFVPVDGDTISVKVDPRDLVRLLGLRIENPASE